MGHARNAGSETFQIFVKPNRQWKPPSITDAEAERFRNGCGELALPPVAHASYLINLASPSEETRERSIQSLGKELTACHRLGISDLVLHPGSHGGDGEEVGFARIAEGLFRGVEAAEGGCAVSLEATAGTGHNLGFRLEHLARIRRDGPTERLSVCLDTAHLFGAGYDMRTAEAVAALSRQVEEILGWEVVAVAHLNDSKVGLGSRKDRHEPIGEGLIGGEGFRAFLAIPRIRRIPCVIETPKGEGMARLNLAKLRDLAG